jgi:vacuolar-type H+-ATPase subunit I/STV1
MLSRSTNRWGDVGDTLSDFFGEIEKKEKHAELENRVRQLRSALKSLRQSEARCRFYFGLKRPVDTNNNNSCHVINVKINHFSCKRGIYIYDNLDGVV